MNDINKQFYNYLWAYVLVALSGCLGNVVDGIIVGNLISADGVSAINLSKPINQFIFTLHLLINAGAGMLVGYALGQKDIPLARRYFSFSLTLSVGIGLLLALFGGVFFIDATTRLLCSNEQILPLARDYAQVLLLGNPAFILMWGLSTMVGVDGQPKLVSLAVIIDNVVNLCLDIVFIQWFDWGITGSSAATVVGHLVGIAILLTHWRKPEHRRLQWSLANFQSSILKKIISQGAPLAVASISLTLLLLSANRIVLSTLGQAGIFAFAVCMNLLQVYNLFLSGTCQTLQSLGAIQVGRRDAEGLRIVMRKSFRFITVAMAVTCLFVWLDPEAIAALFGADHPDYIAETDDALRIFALSFIPFCYIYVLMIVYKLYGHHHMALFISFALSLTVIPVMWAVSKWAPQWLWYSYLIAYLVEALIIFALHRGKQIRFTIS
ncbi:MAG: polysaccharide biosynthesis C-terminal domain-containing protein [Prevotella sp.]|nr:polysaccharide biosynthesis C-terminal domain-containing protein [Prevotella sp.]